MQELERDEKLSYRFFSQHPIFQRLAKNKELFSELLDEIKLYHYSKSETIYRNKEKSECIYLVQDGEIHIVRNTEQAEEQNLVGILRHGNLFGEVSFLNGKAHMANAVAFLDSNLFIIPGNIFRKIIAREPSIASLMMQLLSSRLGQILRDEIKLEKPAKIFTCMYPDFLDRGNQLCVRLTEALVLQSTGPVLLMDMSKNSIFSKKDYEISLTELMKVPFETVASYIRGQVAAPWNFSLVTGGEIYNPDFNSDALSNDLPALLGHFRKYYTSIVVNAEDSIENPVIGTLLSQTDTIILIRNANTEMSKKGEKKWKDIISISSKQTENFFEKVMVISDHCSAHGEKSLRTINNNSALYKSHFYLHTLTAVPLLDNKEGKFIRCLNRIARKLSGTTRGLSLSGGGARALAHIGILEVLDHEGLDFDGITGASMGACIGAYYAMGKDAKSIARLVTQLLPNSSALLEKTIPIVSFFRDRKLNQILLKAFSRIRFEDLDIQFYCNASDLISGQEVVFEKGYLSTAIRASISLPAVFPPIDLGHYRLVDGGVLNNIPGNILRNKGFNKVIGASIVRRLDSNSTSLRVKDRRGGLWKKMKDYFAMPPIINIVNRSVEIQGVALERFLEADFDYIFYPELGEFGMFDFDQIEKIIDKGRKSALDNIEQIKAIV